MFRELVDAARRFRDEGRLQPPFYKLKSVNWIVEIDGQEGRLLGPFRRRGELRSFLVPDRQRSGKVGPDNLKPYLLVDDARYALGLAEPGREDEAQLMHEAFVALVDEAYQVTGDPDAGAVLQFLRAGGLSKEDLRRVQPRDIIAFRPAGAEVFPFEKPAVQKFWADYLGRELASDVSGDCAVCGQPSILLRTLPKEIVVMGQKCQVTSFNLSSFTSFGRSQTTNAPLCPSCAAQVIQALDFMIVTPEHHRVLMRDDSRGRAANPLRNQLAVFWLRRGLQVADQEVEILLGSLLTMPENSEPQGPPPALSQLEELLAAPWSGKDSALRMEDNAFHLAVLTANKGRLMVREWLSVSLADLRKNLARFLGAVKIVCPWGDGAWPLPIPTLLQAVHAEDPNLVRGLLRTAYQGFRVPDGLLQTGLRRARNPRVWVADDGGRPDPALHGLAAALKLALTGLQGEEVGERMVQLDQEYRSPAYLCGRLLAILEEVQRRAFAQRDRGRALHKPVNTTLVERYLGLAMASPAMLLKELIPMVEKAYLKKLRLQQPGSYQKLKEAIEGVLGSLRPEELPKTFSTVQQAELVLGLYHQRAAFRAARNPE